jgi:hypothetical protein
VGRTEYLRSSPCQLSQGSRKSLSQMSATFLLLFLVVLKLRVESDDADSLSALTQGWIRWRRVPVRLDSGLNQMTRSPCPPWLRVESDDAESLSALTQGWIRWRGVPVCLDSGLNQMIRSPCPPWLRVESDDVESLSALTLSTESLALHWLSWCGIFLHINLGWERLNAQKTDWQPKPALMPLFEEKKTKKFK